MIIGQTIFFPVTGGPYYSPWFPRQGDSALFAGELIAKTSSGSLAAVIQTKNSEDTDPGTSTNVLGTILMNGTGVSSTTVASMKELVRFFYNVKGSSGDWVHFRVLPPAWQNNGA